MQYWKSDHAPLVRSCLRDLGAYKYEQLERLAGTSNKRYGRLANTDTPDGFDFATCDGVAIVW